MSWFQEAAGGPAPPTYQDPPEKRKMKDPAIPGRTVTDKAANRPFLAYVLQLIGWQDPSLHVTKV